MANLFFIPKNICMGEGALKLSMDHLKKLGTKALIVTDDAMVRLGNAKNLQIY